MNAFQQVVPGRLDARQAEVVRMLRLSCPNLDVLEPWAAHQLWAIADQMGIKLAEVRVPVAGGVCPDCQVPYSVRGGCGCRR